MPAADPLIGRTIANYHIERLLGRGGMASVYYGFDDQLQRPAAIKVIDDRYSGDAAYAARFVKEARAMASWRHPNIPQVYQAGVEDGMYYYAMEYIQGMDLEELMHRYVQKGELLPFADVIQIGKAIAEALDYAHHKGAIHRDVKPSNVLISEDDRILLTDFGLVLVADKGTKGEVFGSPQYIAPEQARSSADAVSQSDLYSLGVILYEMLVGKLPFEDPSPTSLAVKHISLAPPAPRQINPDLSPELEAVLLKALQKAPQERYQTGRELMTALEGVIQGSSTENRILHSIAPLPSTLNNPPADLEIQSPPIPTQPLPAGHQSPGTLIQPPSMGAPSERAPSERAPSERTPSERSPSEEAFALEGSIPTVAEKRRTAFPKNKAILAAILASITLFLCVCLLASQWLVGKLRQSAPISAVHPSPTLPATRRSATPTVTATVTVTPTMAPTPTSNVSMLHLSTTQDTASFLMTNQGDADLPLAYLRFESKKSDLFGDEWGIGILLPGQCVTVLKSEGHSAPPTGDQCEMVGNVLRRGGSEKFWESQFDVYYQNVKVASCNLEDNDNSCDIQITISP